MMAKRIETMKLRTLFSRNPCPRKAFTEALRGRKHTRGQAIFLALAAIVFLALMTFATWNIGQATHGKMQTMNAADAGAHTLATLVARDLNFMAYSNRAMVANHAVVGQIVSLASLCEMLYLAANDISKLEYLSWVPYIGGALAAIGNAFKAVAKAIDEAVLPGLEILAYAQDGLIRAISAGQVGVHGATVYDMEGIEKVIQANDPELQWATTSGVGELLTTAANVSAVKDTFFGGFTKRRSDTDAYDRMREVVNLSRDGFTVSRGWIPVYVPILVKSKTLFHGGTQLSSDNKTWVAVDAAEIEQWMPPLLPNIWYRFWETGEVAGGSGADDWRKLSHGDLSSRGHRNAYNNRKDRLENTYGGIQPYYELSGDPGPGERPSHTFVVLVYKPVQNSTTPNATQTFGTEEGNPFHLDDGRARIHGVAAAQAYFRRPAGSDNDPSAGRLVSAYRNGTYATLFSPYWQARLTDLPDGVVAGLMAVAD
jgi:hypothetical protein